MYRMLEDTPWVASLEEIYLMSLRKIGPLITLTS